ncbi:acetylajmalan esterase [Rosa chinensis]|uniref:acetylajmalan esterase n=1 Tax=Rosa chinensis TaxID=74649 RepID=UPI000D08BE17|nr:acetylajmalan esterase [Rosa chinensis]
MATKASLLFMLSSLFLLWKLKVNSLFLLRNLSNAASLKACNLEAIYQFGDSFSDTGNAIRENKALEATKLPYGLNLPREPKGRFSDGMLVIDFEAQAAGLPFLKPYLGQEAKDYHNGKNFAVSSASVLPKGVLKEKSIFFPETMTNFTLHKQVDWMATYFNETPYFSKDRAEKLKRSLFFIGPMAHGDYMYSMDLSRKSSEWVKSNLVPDIVQTIKEAATRVIAFGAVKVVIPGIYAFGCFKAPGYNVSLCDQGKNSVATTHNDLLRRAIEELKKQHPNVTIVYADYYSAFMSFFPKALSLGFEPANKPCCFGTHKNGPGHGFNPDNMCGKPGVQSCANPAKRINWDGSHMTQHAYRLIADLIIPDIAAKLKCSA